MKSKILSLIFIFIIIVILLAFCFYKQHQSHVDTLYKLKKTNDNKIETLKSEYEEKIDKEKEIYDSVIIDKESQIMEKVSEINDLQWKLAKYIDYLGVKKNKDNIIKEIETAPNFVVTAYDLSIQSCGKPFSSRAYGITASGKSLKGLDLRTASTISTDPKVIPLGSIVYLWFEKAKEYNGLYISNDTGSAIKGNKIDLFFGDFKSESPSSQALAFGKQKAKVIFLE